MYIFGQRQEAPFYRYLIDEAIELTQEEINYAKDEIQPTAGRVPKTINDLDNSSIYIARNIGDHVVLAYKSSNPDELFITSEMVTSFEDMTKKIEFSHAKMINLCKHYIRACYTNKSESVIINLVIIMQQYYHGEQAYYSTFKPSDWKRSNIAIPAMNQARQANIQAKTERIKLFHEANSYATKTEEAINYINTNFEKWRKSYKNFMDKPANDKNQKNFNLIPTHFKKWFQLIYSYKDNHTGNNVNNKSNRSNKTLQYYFQKHGKTAKINSYIRTYLSNI